MENKIKVSVVVPIYNVEEYLEECLDSLVKQTLKDIEVLMIDDGSTDHSASIAKRFDEKYAHFHYLYKENGGLGNARNYAIPYVKGEYLIFLDSDDIVPADAYKKMYDMAVKTGNDMVIGNVKRFNTTREWGSPLHQKVFDDDYEYTHILKKPELVYDTTSWNKLFKTSFYLENNFQFPEKILYEDIPVTIPAHFKAKSISIITDICYLWRMRDGVSKSITQNRTEIKNFADRIKIMDMVNDFYEKNVTDKQALFMKDYKWLDIDLKLYVNQFLEASEEYIEIAKKEINRYLSTINPEAFRTLRNIDQMKYFYIKENKITELLNLLDYQKTAYKSLRIKKTSNGYYGDFPMKDIPNEMKNMTRELEFYPLVQSIQNIHSESNKLYIDSTFYISRLKRQDEFEVKAYLSTRNGDKLVSLPIVRKKSKDLTSKNGYRFCRKPMRIVKYDYSQSLYTICIDYSDEKVLELMNSEEIYFIRIKYENELINHNFLLGKSNRDGYNVSNYYMFDSMLINTLLMNDGNLQIRKNKKTYFVEKVQLNNVNLIIPELDEYTLNGMNHTYHSENSKINLLEIEDDRYLVLFEEKNNVHMDNNPIYFVGEDKTIIVENSSSGNMEIKKFDNPLLATEIQRIDNSLIIYVQYHSKLKLNNPQMIISNKLYNYDIKINPEKVIKNDNVTLKFNFDINDSTISERLSQGNYSFKIQGDVNHIYDLNFVKNINSYVIKLDDRDLKVWIENNKLNLHIDHQWRKLENTAKKRLITQKYIYPLLRLLPIQKKCVVFEGWWGAKYHCNPKYLYEYINKNYPEYKCVWMLNDSYIPINGTGKRVRRKSLEYYYYLAVGKYFVNNVNFHDEYEKRKSQIEIQTMHGTPLKTLGLDVPGELDDPEARKKFLRRCDRWDYLVVQSQKASEITASCYAFKKKFLRTGYPRNDILFEKNNINDIQKIKEKLSLPLDKKVIMYAPTWRRRNYFDIHMDLEDMKKTLGDDYILLLRIHPFAYAGFDESILNDFVYNFSTYESIEELYLISDVVITDYSSVMFDYTILDRPILFYTYDLQEYRDFLRGFNFNFEKEAPGPLLETYEELKDSLINLDQVSNDYYNQLQLFRKKFNEYETGTASKQIFDEVFKS